MIKPLQTTSKFFATSEDEAKNHIEEVKNQTRGHVIRQDIQKKEHKEYGEYYEVVIIEKYQTSKDVLEGLAY